MRMSKNVTQILEWEASDGVMRSLLIVEDLDLPKSDVKRKTIELSEYNSSTDEWETGETLDSVEELESFGIPESLVD